jgi:ATP-binding cassette subfamily F protein uup
MNILSVENVSKSYGTKVLFKNISFGLDQGQKIGLLARNGAGKSSLLKILTGNDISDSGNVVMRNGISVAFLGQEPIFDKNNSVLEAALSGSNPSIIAVKEYEYALEQCEKDPTEKNSDLLTNAIDKIDELNAWDYESKVKQILSKLQITNLLQPVSTLSGGQLKRVALSKVLIDDPDFLILDEPTNHLDVEMIEWLEEYLISKDTTLLLVTHDRYFLDRICDEILELENGQLYRYKGNFSYFMEKKAEREFNEGREVDKAQNLMRKELEWIRKMPKARTTKSKSRIDAFYDLEEKATGRKVQDEMELNVKMSRIGGKIIELKKVYKSFGDVPIVKGFDYTFKTGERIGIVGKNGIGKSTFLNMLMGLEQPDSGKINVGETVVFGYYSQKGLELKEDKRVMEVVKDITDVIPLSDGSKVNASQFLQLFKFPPDIQYTYVSKLSGGEKRRLYLLTVLMKNPNFLILDEPTNDLDLLTLGILEDFLSNFKGCLVIVSHDRYFMDKLVDHLFIFEGDGIISDFNGSYNDYRDKMIEQEKEIKRAIPKKEAPVVVAKAEPISDKKEKLTFKEKFEHDALQKEIPELEEEKRLLEKKLESNIADHQELTNCTKRIGEVIQLIDEKSLRWLELSEKI